MKKTLKTLMLLLLLFGYSNLDAQIFKKLGEKISKMEQKIEKKSGEATDKVLDSIFENPKKPKNSKKKNEKVNSNDSENTTENLGGFGNIMAMMGKPVVIEDQYIFTSTITMEQYGKKTPSGSMKQSISEHALLSENSGSKIILDTKNNATITLIEDKKEAQTVTLDIIEALSKMGGNTKNNEPESALPTITNLSNTKNIMGYLCKGTRIENENIILEIWHTDQVKIETSPLMEFASKLTGKSNKAIPPEAFNNFGFPMQTDVLDNDNSVSYGTKVTSIENTPFTINMKDYKLIQK